MDHAQSQSGPFAGLLGGEERLEYLVADLGRHARAGVGHGDHHVGARTDIRVVLRIGFIQHHICGLQHQLAAAGHGVPCVDCQVDQRICELGGVDQRRRHATLQF